MPRKWKTNLLLLTSNFLASHSSIRGSLSLGESWGEASII